MTNLNWHFSIGFETAHRLGKYTPDFYVRFKQVSLGLTFLGREIKQQDWIIEVKPKEKLEKADDRLKERLQSAKEYANQNKIQFEIFTDEEIDTTYLKNIKWLANIHYSGIFHFFHRHISPRFTHMG